MKKIISRIKERIKSIVYLENEINDNFRPSELVKELDKCFLKMNKKELDEIYIPQAVYELAKFINFVVSKHNVMGCRVLDLGCGYGLQSILVSEQENTVVAAEIDHERLSILRKLLRGMRSNLKVSPYYMRGEKLEFQDGFFDIVYCSQVIHHMSSPRETVREAHRLLRKGGKIIIFDRDKRSLNSLLLYPISILPKLEKNIYLKKRREIIQKCIAKHKLVLCGKLVSKITRKTKGWDKQQILKMFAKSGEMKNNWKRLLKMYAPVWKYVEPVSGGWGDHFYTPREVSEMLKTAGFKEVKIIKNEKKLTGTLRQKILYPFLKMWHFVKKQWWGDTMEIIGIK